MTAKVAEVEEAGQDGDIPASKELWKIIDLDDVLKNYDEKQSLKSIVTAEEVMNNGLRGNFCTSREKYHSKRPYSIANMSAIVAPEEQGLKSESWFTKRKRILQEASSVALSAQYCALYKTEKAQICLQKLKGANELLEIALVSTDQANDDDRRGGELATKRNFDYSFETGPMA